MDLVRQYAKQFLSESRKQTQKFEAEDYLYAYTTPDLAEDGGWVTSDSVEELRKEWIEEVGEDVYGSFNVKKVLVMKPATSVDKAMVLIQEPNTGGDIIYPSIDQAINNPETGLYAREWEEGAGATKVTEAEIQELLQTKDLERAEEILEKTFIDYQDFGAFDGLYEYVSGMMPKDNGMDPEKVFVPSSIELPKINKDYDYWKRVLRNSPYKLRKVPETMITSELCKIAVREEGRVLDYVPDKFKTPELCKMAIKNDALAFEYVPEKLKTPELCKFAVKTAGYALKYVPEKLKTPELCLLAVQHDMFALGDVPEKLKTLELCIAAVKYNDFALIYVPDNLKAQVKQELGLS